MPESQLAEINAPARRRGVRRSLAICLCASAAVHAGVFGVLPAFMRDDGPAQVSVLEVTLLPPEPLPMAPPEPEPHDIAPQRMAAKPAPQRRPDTPAPVLALPESQAPAESAFVVPAPRPAEAPAPEQKAQVVSVAVAPPVFNAAYLRNPAPRYPVAARRAGEQGTVTLRVLVTRDGVPARVDVEKTSGSVYLDNAALEAVKAWRFNPARRGTEAVEGLVLVPIVFRLEGPS